MSKTLLFSFSDIGKNNRILSHARLLSKIGYMHVYIVGYDISRVPLDIEKAPNISLISINSIDTGIPAIQALLFPLIFIYHLLQFIGIMLTMPKLDFILLTMNTLILESSIGKIAAKIFKVKFIIDIDNFSLTNDGSSMTRKSIETKMIKKADVVFAPTLATQMILNLRGIDAVLLRDIPPRYGEINSRVDLYEEPIVGVITSDFNEESVSELFKLIKQVDETKRIVHFHLFCTSKSVNLIRMQIKDYQPKNCSIKYLNVNAKSYFVDLQQCFVGVLINSTDVLNINKSAIEMFGAGVPIIARRFGCISELIKNEQNGFLYEEKDELILVLMKALNSPSVLKMRKNILQMRDNQINNHETIFRKVINNEELPKFQIGV